MGKRSRQQGIQKFLLKNRGENIVFVELFI
ncbi:hypothetical protein J2T13_004622 [Paenibacillus sp. DS2015]